MSEWERVNDTCHRLRVPGGWLYRTWLQWPFSTEVVVTASSVRQTFVPDPDDEGL